jgi:integrase
MAKKLTAVSVANVRPGPRRREISDGGTGLFLVVQPSGKKSFALRYRRPDKRPAKLTFDGEHTLSSARKAAADALHDLARGIDPATTKFEARTLAAQADTERKRDTVEQLATQFLERHVRAKLRPSSRQQAEHVFNNIVLPVWHGRIVHDIRRRDVIDLIEGVAKDRPVMANRVLAQLSKFFNWLVSRDVTVASPCAGVARPSAEQARERILSDGEIKALWQACDAVGGSAGACIKTMLLTGQRRSEVAGMRRSEIAGDVWMLAPMRTKNKRAHAVPLPTQALAIIETAPRIAGDFIFTTTGASPLAHFARIKRDLDVQIKPEERWVLHDVRRTVASGMARIGVALPVIEKVLNHTSGSFRGIVATYQRHDFATEKRDALQRWADHVDDLVKGKPAAKVIKPKFGRR